MQAQVSALVVGNSHHFLLERKGMTYPFEKGQRLMATAQVTENGRLPGDPNAQFPQGAYIHAEPGDVGVVEGVDDGIPTVRFDRTGTATIVGEEEVRPQ